MRKTVVALLITLICSGAGTANSIKVCIECDPVFGSTPCVQDSTSLICGDVPVLWNRTYVVGYGEARLNPLWVSYRIYSVAPVGSAPSHGWRIDCRTDARVSDTDYKYTGYQRGHMTPKSAMYHCYGPAAVYDTFQLSNASPQLGEFNNGPWGDLEDLVRENYSISCSEVWIIAGPIFDDSNGCAYLTKNDEHTDSSQTPVEIPDGFYKIIIDKLKGEIRTLAFLMDHSETYGYGEGGSIVERLSGFLVSIDEIELRTGLDFFWELDATTQVLLESEPSLDMW
ncbi:DNA/RNA non-specific endonuclease [Candidatus Bipolaricaulota bacterium]|nr:DNA/RNA non-specific endonuclease [Candidatus Bipolaricaulota bacterium]